MFRLALTRLLTASRLTRNSSKIITHHQRYFSSQSNNKVTLADINEGKPSRRMGIQFRCKICDHTLQKTFTRQSYEHGLVIIRCDSCTNLHLIADNLGWFKDITENGKLKNIAQILQAKGETIHYVKVAPTNDESTLEEIQQTEKLQLNEGTVVTS